MEQYTIPCTEEQTRRAFELGAPINTDNNPMFSDFIEVKKGLYAIVPTAEQMIGWLEEQEDILFINIHLYEDDGYPKMYGYGFTIYNKNKDIITGTFTEKGDLVYICPKSKEYIGLVGTYANDFLTKEEATLVAIDVALDYLTKQKTNHV